MPRYDRWSLQEFLEELFFVAEVIEVPGMKERLAELKAEIKLRFTRPEREAAGLQF